jgi:hypothetical protein
MNDSRIEDLENGQIGADANREYGNGGVALMLDKSRVI